CRSLIASISDFISSLSALAFINCSMMMSFCLSFSSRVWTVETNLKEDHTAPAIKTMLVRVNCAVQKWLLFGCGLVNFLHRFFGGGFFGGCFLNSCLFQLFFKIFLCKIRVTAIIIQVKLCPNVFLGFLNQWHPF